MKTILILMDSLNKRFLDMYGGWAKTPNLDRLAEKSCVFKNHFVGSAPCMPARHDIMTGRVDFLERNWGPMMPFDCSLPHMLKKHGIFSEIITDHYHYFRFGGENYVEQFSSWSFLRGQEFDPWVPDLGKPIERRFIGRDMQQYERNRTRFIKEEDYPSPRCFAEATKFVEDYRDEDFFLFLDTCDPHEPYDFPDGYERQYPDDYDGDLFYWPKYGYADGIPEEAKQHVRNRYAETITMSDRWLGKLLDVLDKYSMWDDTAVFFVSDHGFMLGEKNLFGKNIMNAYNEIYHLPFMVHLPGMNTRTECNALTQNIDLMPTILDLYGIPENECWNRLHGHSLLPLLRGETDKVRDTVLYGIYGKQVCVFDGRYSYIRAAQREDNLPLYLYTAVPLAMGHFWDQEHLKDLDRIETGRFLKWTEYPVFRIPADTIAIEDVTHRFTPRSPMVSDTLLFDEKSDPDQEHPIRDEALEKEMCKKLADAMRYHDSPDEQFVRLGLEEY